jgi:hypothetical protein
VGDQYSE